MLPMDIGSFTRLTRFCENRGTGSEWALRLKPPVCRWIRTPPILLSPGLGQADGGLLMRANEMDLRPVGNAINVHFLNALAKQMK